MKQVLIVYGSKYGCARECALQLQQQIKAKITLLDVSKWKKGKSSLVCDSDNQIYDGMETIDISPYDFVIVGGSFYIGKWQAGVADFLATHMNTLVKKKLAFFACHMQQGSELEHQLSSNIPDQLAQSAIAIGRFGGLFDVSQMNIMEKLIVKQVARAKREPFASNTIDSNAIKQFVWEIERNL